jgi:predicted ribosome quality control (RQC) complex YloA/Tae2 family protein
MHALLAAHLAELLAELRGLLVGRRLREVQPLPPRDLLLVFEDGERVLRLRLSADPEAPRIHLNLGRVLRHEGPVGPWFTETSATLAGATLAALEQPRGDRIALLRFRDGVREGTPRPVLIAELTGRHANLVLCDGSELVLATLVEPPAAKQPPRLVRGQPWQPPRGAPAEAPATPPLAEVLPEPPAGAEGASRRELAPLSFRVEYALGGNAVRVRTERAGKALRQRLERKLERTLALRQGLRERAAASAGAERVRQDGELLKHHLASLQRGQRSVDLADWFDPTGAPRRLELDPKLSPVQNVERLFDRYHKLLRAASEVERESELAAAREARLRALLERLAAEDADPEALEAEAVAAQLLEPLVAERDKRVQVAAPRLPYRTFRATSGAEILVGRSARDNDTLSLRVARGSDLWLHTSDSPGSHVLLRLARGQEPHPEDVLDAAHLAAHFSPLSKASRVSVHVVPAKQVRKPKGAAPGLVTVAGGKLRQIRIEPERLSRLLDAGRAGEGRTGPEGGGEGRGGR